MTLTPISVPFVLCASKTHRERSKKDKSSKGAYELAAIYAIDDVVLAESLSMDGTAPESEDSLRDDQGRAFGFCNRRGVKASFFFCGNAVACKACARFCGPVGTTI